jgi:hypothetical protein
MAGRDSPKRMAGPVEPGAPAKTDQPLIGCWVSTGWRNGLDWRGHDDWGKPSGRDQNPGLVQVLVVREMRRGPISWCGYLIDTGCLGVKDAIGPRDIEREDLDRLSVEYFKASGGPPERISIELAQHLVLGAIEFARGLGFEPHQDFYDCSDYLGAFRGPSAIRFGVKGRPYFVSGPYDNVRRILATLRRSVGEGNFDYLPLRR